MKKRWLRFSLRRLIIAVLGVAMCWTLTATWGPSTVFRNWDPPAWERRQEGSELHLFSPKSKVTADAEDAYAFHAQFRLRCIAIFPCVIRTTIDVRFDEKNFAHETTYYYVWIFGYSRKIASEHDIEIF